MQTIFSKQYAEKTAQRKPIGTNRAFFSAGNIQPKLSVNKPGDAYEQEADTMADRVMSMRDSGMNTYGEKSFFNPPSPGIQRKPHNPEDELDKEILHRKEKPGGDLQRKCAGCEEEENLQRKEGSDSEPKTGNQLDSYVSSLNGGGRPLPESSRSFFEPRFGLDFSHVRIHDDPAAAKSAQSINALAYTSGNNIVFNNSQYSPDHDGGKKLLAHELTHVVQQNQGIAPKEIQRLTLSPVGNLVKGPCGEFSRSYDFALGQPAATDGYIVQQIDRYDNEVKCPGFGACPANPTSTYWEAFYVRKNSTAFYRSAALGRSDDSSHKPRPNTDGARYAYGESRFFPIATTGFLGMNNRAGLWKPGNAGGVSHSLSLPSSAAQPTWWGQYTEGPQTRSVTADWRCCGDSSDYNKISSNP